MNEGKDEWIDVLTDSRVKDFGSSIPLLLAHRLPGPARAELWLSRAPLVRHQRSTPPPVSGVSAGRCSKLRSTPAGLNVVQPTATAAV